MKNSTEREQLLRQLERSRRNLDRSLHSVGHSLDVSHRLETSLRKNTGWWIGGSLVAGIVIATLAGPRRTREDSPREKSSLRAGATASLAFLGPILKEVLVLFLPSLKSMLLHSAETWLSSPDRKRSSSSPDE